MKRYISIILTVILMLTCVVAVSPAVNAASKETDSRAIAIVFDNSGSMYDSGDQAWCRATYAMEVFASMLNAGDVLHIYPMHPIQVGTSEYTMENPLKITNSSQATSIRDIYTLDAGGTPIESIDCAVEGLKTQSADKKYLLVLTDGGTFSKNGHGLTKERTKTELDKRFQAEAGEAMTVMYLGISTEACIPDTQESEYFVKKQAANTADVLSTLTEMCNLIFGRDTLPKSRISGNVMEFDISMSKLIVFVQGNNISNLKIQPKSEGSNGKMIGTQQTKYSTKGAADYKSVPDTSLQGMIVTYEDCDAGSYEISYSGTETSIEVYYEPNADLDFVFKDTEGNIVDMSDLYEGEYKVSFGLKDAKTGQLIESDLLGDPHYVGSYTINGEKTPFTHDGYSGEVPISLKMNDTFEAELTVTYLSGYTISKDSSDFGCPEGGVRVLAPPLGKFKVDLQAPQKHIVIKKLGDAEELTATLTIGGKKLTPEEFKSVTLKVDGGGLEYQLTPDEQNSQYKIKLLPTKGVESGKYKVSVTADYLDEAERTANSSDSVKLNLSHMALWLIWLLWLLGLLLLILLIILILRIKVLPKYVKSSTEECSLSVGGRDVTPDADFYARLAAKQLMVYVVYNGEEIGRVMLNKLAPGKDSYLYKPSHKRTILVKSPENISFSGDLTKVDVAGIEYVIDKDGAIKPYEEQQGVYTITNGSSITMVGQTMVAGKQKKFNAEITLNFRK